MTTTPRILADEPDALVVFKPGGWSTHDAGPASHPTLSQWLIENRWHEAHPVHRLDKPTSGIVLVGKTPEARTRLSGWFASGEVHKEYLALVHGKCRAQGVWKRPFERRPAREAPGSYHTLQKAGALETLFPRSYRPGDG